MRTFLSSLKKNPKIFWLALSLIATLIVYSRSLTAQFTNWDDNVYVTENLLVKNLNWNNIKTIFGSSVSDVYSPLTIFNFSLEYHFFGPNPTIFHFTNIFLHLAVVSLIFFLVLDLGFSTQVAGLSALIFGLHPIHVESVAWVTERKDVLYAFFYLLSLRYYIRYQRGGFKAFYLYSVIFALLSMLSKPMALSLPLVLFIMDWWTRRKWYLSLILDKIIYFLIVGGIGWVTYAHHARIPWNSASQAIIIWIYTFSFYIKNFFLPFDLTPYYQLPQPISMATPAYFSSFAILGICLILFIVDRSRVWRLAMMCYFFSIFFLLRFDQGHDLNIVSDRFMYLPCLGFCLWLGQSIADVWQNLSKSNVQKLTAIILIFVIFVMWPFKTVKIVEVWQNSISLWSYVIKRNPNLSVAYNNRGEAYSAKGLHELAIADYNKALELDPLHVSSYNNRADALMAKGQTDLAVKDYDKSIEIQRNVNFQAYYNRANIHLARQELDLALADYNKALVINPDFPQAYNNRGVTYLNLTNLEKALDDFNQTIRLDPKFSDAYNNRGYVLVKLKDYKSALESFEKCLSLNPRNNMAYYNRGNAFRMMGDYSRAVEDLSKAIAVNNSFAMAYWNRSIAYAFKQEWNHAFDDAQKAQSLGVNPEEIYMNYLKSHLEGHN
jgi:tetratricopeptide (TPR) repeat protein